MFSKQFGKTGKKNVVAHFNMLSRYVYKNWEKPQKKSICRYPMPDQSVSALQFRISRILFKYYPPVYA